MKGETLKKYFLLTVVALGAGVIYKVTSLREVFYDAMLAGFQITNTQLGTLSSIFGTVSMICYLPGGILADKVSYKKTAVFFIFGQWSFNSVVFDHAVILVNHYNVPCKTQ